MIVVLYYICNMQEIFEIQTQQKKSKIQPKQGFQTLVFFDAKISELNEQKIYPAGTQVIFVKNAKFDVFWGTREKIVFDVNDELLHVGLSGEMQVQIKNFKKFFCDVLNGKQKFDEDDLHDLIVPVTTNQLDIFLKKYTNQNNLDPTKIESFKSEMSRVFRVELGQKLENMFGIGCTNFMTLRVLVDELELEKIKQKNMQILLANQMENLEKKQQKELQTNSQKKLQTINHKIEQNNVQKQTNFASKNDIQTQNKDKKNTKQNIKQNTNFQNFENDGEMLLE